MGSDYEEEIKKISYDDILSYTGNLSADNKIGNFQFGEVYRGKMGEKVVTVKIWRNTRSLYFCLPGHNQTRFHEELILQTLGGVTSYCRVAKMIGYCDNEDENRLAAVYNLNPLDTLQNLMLKDNLTWLQRVKVAYQLADLLKFLHTAPMAEGKLPYLVRNLNPAHIMIEQDYNPTLYDFSMFSGGILPDRSHLQFHIVPGYLGYIDPASCYGVFYTITDVFAFGVILLSLIIKKVFIAEDHIDKNGVDEHADVLLDGVGFLNEWAEEEYGKLVAKCGKGNVSLVHQSFEDDQDFELADGLKITDLVMDCLTEDLSWRPEIEEVIDLLDGLLVVQRNPDTFGIGTNRGHIPSHDEASEVGV